MGALNRIVAASPVRILAVCSLAGLGAVAGLLFLSRSASAPAIAPTAPVEVSTFAASRRSRCSSPTISRRSRSSVQRARPARHGAALSS